MGDKLGKLKGVKVEKISVIIPVYNVEKYIDKCVKSVLNQSYKEIEIVLVNDGSTDSCLDLCEQYSKKDSRIIVVNKANGGLSSARNAGIDVATGEYIVFIDADDFVCSDYIEKLYNAIKLTKSDMAVCGIEIVDEQGNKTNRLSTGNIYNESIPFTNECMTPYEMEKRYYTDKNGFMYVVAWNKIYSKYIFKKLRYDVGKIFEDEYIFPQLIRKCKKIVFIPDKLYFYVQRNSGITSRSKQNDKLQYITEIYERRENIYREEANRELLSMVCEKFLRQSISYYIYLDKKGRYQAKKNYSVVLKKCKMPLKYYFLYPFMGVVSKIKYLKERK